jgi:homoserine dehydrogenase
MGNTLRIGIAGLGNVEVGLLILPRNTALREGLVGNRVTKLFGIMNGTCNYILTKMANEGRSFAAEWQRISAALAQQADSSHAK